MRNSDALPGFMRTVSRVADDEIGPINGTGTPGLDRSPSVLVADLAPPCAFPLPRYFLKRLKRIKKSNGEIISVGIRSEKRPGTIKNYAIA